MEIGVMILGDEYWPNWEDGGRRVACKLEDGRLITGELEADDWYDIPIFSLVTIYGEEISFVPCDILKWKFLD